MKTSTLAFFIETYKSTHIYRLPDDYLVPTHECYSHSVLLSMAAYMVWKFPYLAPPAIQGSVEPVYTEETFPDRLAITHPMYDYWVELFLQSVLSGNALRADETLYLRIRVNSDYAEVLKQHDFREEQVHGKLSWRNISPILDEEKLRSHQKKKLVLVLTCSLLKTNRGSFHAPAIITGLFFNNENWKTFRVMKNQYPSKEDYHNVTHIIVPGSTLCLSINIEPQIIKLMDQLRVLFATNHNVKYLGICYGHQLLSWILNPGSVRRAKTGTFGINKIKVIQSQTLQRFDFLKGVTSVNMYEVHNDQVFSLPDGFLRVAESSSCNVEMMVSNDGRAFCMQAHPQYTPSRYRSIVALNKMFRQEIGREQILQIINKENEIPDESLIGQQICRRFLNQ